MDSEILNSEIEALKNENKVLKGKIRGYQTLSHLFQETKEKNRSLQVQLQAKEMVSVGTEIQPDSLPSFKNELPEKTPTNLSEITNPITKPAEEKNLEDTTPIYPLEPCSPIEIGEENEVVLHLRKKLEDALLMIGEVERKRSSEKVLMKILNEEVKKTKDEVLSVKEKLEKTFREKELVMKKVALLERQRDNIPQNAGVALKATNETEGAEDWVHLQQEMETEETDEKDYQIQQLKHKCRELQEKASRWENEHFNLQMEYTKHVNDLRLLLQSKSKELVHVTEGHNSEKKALEAKFQSLELMMKKEKDAKLESYNLHQETMRKYKALEKKFLALEEKNKDPILNDVNPNASAKVTRTSPVSASENVNVSGLQQQVNLFKVDFEKEKKERIFAEKRAKEFEEKLRYLSKELERKEKQAEYERIRMKQISGNPANAAKMPKMPSCWACVYCTFLNDPQVEECKICKAPKFARKELPAWKCPSCNFPNNHKAFCSMCNREKIRNANPGYGQVFLDDDDDLAIDGPKTEPA